MHNQPKANILKDYRSQHFNTVSPKAFAGLIDALDRSRFTPTFLARRDAPDSPDS
jgi:hypothetical protein